MSKSSPLFVFMLIGCLATASSVQPPASRQIKPIHRSGFQPTSTCGHDWQRQYRAAHARIMAGRAPQRFVVSLGIDSGLADRLTGSLSVFYYALLSGRAFQIATYPGVVSLREALEPATVDWNREDVDDHVIQNIKINYNGTRFSEELSRPVPASVNTSQYWPMFLCSDKGMADFMSGDIRRKPADHVNTTTVVISSNRGQIWNLFDNPYHQDTLFKYGLRPDIAAPCAFHYLFRPHPEVKAMFQSVWDTLTEPSTLKIGIQVRAGDRVLQDGSPDVANVTAWRMLDPFLACAAEIEESRALPGQAVIYYLVSDSMAVRRVAKALLGDKVVTDVDTPAAHVGCEESGNCSHGKQVWALRRALGEMLAFSMADYHVYTHNSGFGRIGAWLSYKWHHQYTINLNDKNAGFRKCGITEYDDLRHIARVPAGVQ